MIYYPLSLVLIQGLPWLRGKLFQATHKESKPKNDCVVDKNKIGYSTFYEKDAVHANEGNTLVWF